MSSGAFITVVCLEFTLEDAGGDVRYRLVTGGQG